MTEEELCNLQCVHRHSTDNRNMPSAHLVVTPHRERLMVEVQSNFPPGQVNRVTRRYSRNEHVDHVHTQEIFEARWDQQ